MADSTLYPKISDKITSLVRNYNNRTICPEYLRLGKNIDLIGTVKLHGTHADIVIHSDNRIQLQTRNVTNVTLENDQFNFAEIMLPQAAEIAKARNGIVNKFKELNPTVKIDFTKPVILAGEWVGQGIMKGVALNQLQGRCFVILSISVNGKWLPNQPYGHFRKESIGIYNIAQGGYFRETIRTYDKEKQKSLEKLRIHTEAVVQECPFAKKVFGISGPGEGIVWRAEYPFGEDARFWLKTKGESFAGSVSVLKGTSLLAEASNSHETARAKAFAEKAVTERRLEQGLEYMEEHGIPILRESTGRFMDWLRKDVEIEEADVIKELGIDVVSLRKLIDAISKQWYYTTLANLENAWK